MSLQLCLSLGTDSSSILLKNGEILCGYKNERLSKIKNDSSFPLLAIEACLKEYEYKEINEVYISHSDTFGDLNGLNYRYYNKLYMSNNFKHAKLYTISKKFTLHDALYHSAKIFSKNFKEDFTIIANNFGSYGETISIYKKDKLIERVFGYDTSLGLFYQYAISFVGLKPNQDDYKLLGYENKIFDILSGSTRRVIYKRVRAYTKEIRNAMLNPVPEFKFDPVGNKAAIITTKLYRTEQFKKFMSEIDCIDKESKAEKIIISFIAQRTVEEIILGIIDKYKIKKVLLSGSVFKNIKLNNEVSKRVDAICVSPLCGDYGASLGIYRSIHKNIKVNDLYWGTRFINPKELNEKILYVSIKKVADLVNSYLSQDKIVNIVTGKMEFGSRSLLNTSTLALPTEKNAKYINLINSEKNIVPMPIAVTNTGELFKLNNIHISNEFKAIAQNYKYNYTDISGVQLAYYNSGSVSGLPQIIKKKHPLYNTIEKYGILINTDFNTYGTPLVCEVNDINNAVNYQNERDYYNRVVTIVTYN